MQVWLGVPVLRFLPKQKLPWCDITATALPSSVIIGSYLRSIIAHRALPDVEAMEEVFTKTALVDLLSSLPIQSAKQQLQKWHTLKEQRCRTSSLLYALGKQVTSA